MSKTKDTTPARPKNHIINSAGRLLLQALKELVVAKELATQKVVTVSLEDNLYNALEKVTSKDFSILPVVSPDDSSKLLGILTRRDIIGAYNKAVIKKSFPK